MNLTLNEMPKIGPAYFRALLSARRRPGPDPVIPALCATFPDLRVDPAHLAAYRTVCGFAEGDALPISYPHVLAASIQITLMNRPEFPLPLLGLVHLRNRIVQSRALRPDEGFTVNVRVEEGGRRTDKGLEFDFVTEYLAGGERVWEGTATILHRAKAAAKKPGGKPPPRDGGAGLAHYEAFDAPADIGRRYGKIAGDLNPIHLSPTSAKLFGYPRHIAHGMWSLARCAALLEGKLALPPREFDVAFKQPLFLPGKVALRYQNAHGGFEFALLSRNSDKVHLTGSLR